MDDDLIAAHRDMPTLMPFLHLPVQSGSDRILAAMNRKHTADDYRRIVDRLRDARPDIALSSDFIVGHPGETEADFQATLALVREVGFAQAYSFKYSPRPGTPAAGAPAQVPEADKDRRLQALQALLRDQQTDFNAGCVGLDLPVLFTGPGRHPGQIAGRSPFLQPVHLTGNADLIGTEVNGANRRRPSKLTRGNPCPGETNSLTHLAAPQAPRSRSCRHIRRQGHHPPVQRQHACCPCCSGTTTAIWCGSSRRWGFACPAGATALPSRATRPGSMSCRAAAGSVAAAGTG